MKVSYSKVLIYYDLFIECVVNCQVGDALSHVNLLTVKYICLINIENVKWALSANVCVKLGEGRPESEC